MPSPQSISHTPPIVLTMGDPAGISTEITALAWARRKEEKLSPFFALSRASLFETLARTSGMKVPVEVINSPLEAAAVFAHALPVLQLSEIVSARPGKPDPSAGDMTITSISQAVDYIQKGEASSLVTNPINKHVLYQAGFTFPGHTEYLAKLAESWGHKAIRPVMMLASKQLRTVPLTIHIPLEKVCEHVTSELLQETVRIVSQDLTRYFGLQFPRIVVAGLNPHAGESGAMGTAEIDIIAPAIQALQKEGLHVSGPFPADTLFHAAARKNYDVVIGMYHDQALIPIKTLSFDEGVNTTLGLPFVRTSPDHGTAYDIAGKGLANPQSLIEALKLAHQMSEQSRKQA